jgi:sulfite reductase beta subunit-like hemoprotein
MAVHDNTQTVGRARLSFAKVSDIDEFAEKLGQFERGEITADQWKKFRLLRGTYGQRQDEDAHMLRVKVPQGVLSAEQLEALADIGDRYSRGFGHITTRQNIQFHFVTVHNAELAMRRGGRRASRRARRAATRCATSPAAPTPASRPLKPSTSRRMPRRRRATSCGTG